MKLPAMSVIKRSVSSINRFGGLDQRSRPYDNNFAAMKNMTCERLPVMAARRPRLRLRTLRRPGGIFAHEKLCWVDGTDFVYDGVAKGTVAEGEKQFVRMGAFVLIWPDAVYYNTHTDEFGSLNRTYTTTGSTTAALCKLGGELYEYTVSQQAPEEPVNGQCWLDKSQSPNVFKIYDETRNAWNSVQTVYTKITSKGIGVGFKANDAVNLRGFTGNTDLNGSFYLVDAADDFIIIVALIAEAFTQTRSVTIERKMPDMDFVAEAGNRVWGASNAKHEIYASALGDPTNWNQFLGLASDSYAVTVGTAGDFTGAASHLGNALFFKQDVVHQMMGTKPSDFTLSANTCRGVAKGCEKSLVHVNENLLYMAPLDVCMMGMSTLPATISEMLGKEVYKDAIGGALGSRYFLSVRHEGKRELLVYDTQNGAWCREDGADVTHFAQLDNELYMLYANGEIWSVNGTAPEYLKTEDAKEEDAVEWELETGDIGLDEPYSKYISSVQLHVACSLGSSVSVSVRYDSDHVWEELFRLDPVNTRSMTIPVIPKRCRTLRIRLRGRGAFELYSITKNIEQGSDVYAHK